MKHLAILAALAAAWFFIPHTVYAGGMCEVTITNKTLVNISEILVEEAGNNNEKKHTRYILQDNLRHEKDVSIKFKKDVEYNIYLLNANNQILFGKTGCKWNKDADELNIHVTGILGKQTAEEIIDRSQSWRIKRIILN